ncbi:hypothetical protein HC028_19205 [Planosporangium flavigriseum]|uniref:Uncharacterized protein n=1 Tax=Planosporangium flavigriseum TaxID=373681 RepID=A0A8J3LHN5_9ACTN|nr:hypothetical protein [Planosporangium flavigriseum]NJC66620.1 hypothetical protein [Planosporangium flavigriseum]GIG73493.1 hypothetical protein Pfl04_18970 [Planosporangium flavigriseum]
MAMKPAVLSNGEEVHEVLPAIDAWEAAGGELGTHQAAEECRHREPRPAVEVPAGGGGIAYPPRQRSRRVVAAGWLRRRSEPEVSE